MRVTSWQAARTSDGGAVRREVRYIDSGGTDLFVWTYASQPTRRPFALLVCPGWGHEAMWLAAVQHGLAAGMASLGGLGVAFEYPGQGESGGDPTTATLGDMSQAAIDVGTEVRKTFTGRLVVAGLRLGAAVSALASTVLDPAAMALIWPELDPEAYFAETVRRSRRANLGDPESEGMAFGVPVSSVVLDSVRGTAGTVREVLESVVCPVGVVRDQSASGGPADGGHMCVIPVAAKAGRGGDDALIPEAVLGWLNQRTESE